MCLKRGACFLWEDDWVRVEMPCYPKEFLGTSREMLNYFLDKPGCCKEMLDAPETCGVPK